MANKEQLEILKQGVKRWNQWRKDHPDEKIDLRGADMQSTNLQKANLREINLRGADLTKADLTKADLIKADLIRTKLQGANLRGANLAGAHLVQANLSKADITGANLYGTARNDWKITGINCDYCMLLDYKGGERTPKDRNFYPGEFEELYKQLPTFEYVFEHGFTPLDAVAMDRIVAAINAQHPEFELKLDSFHSRSQPHATFTVLHKEHVEVAKQQVAADYETQIKVLEGQRDQANQQLREFMAMLLSRPQIGAVHIGNNVKNINTDRDYIERIDGNAQVTTGGSGTAPEINDIAQLTTKEALAEHYNLLCDKLSRLGKALILENDPTAKFKLEHQIAEAEALRNKIQQRLEEIGL